MTMEHPISSFGRTFPDSLSKSQFLSIQLVDSGNIMPPPKVDSGRTFINLSALSIQSWSIEQSASTNAIQLAVDSRAPRFLTARSEEHTSELQSRPHLVCRL